MVCKQWWIIDGWIALGWKNIERDGGASLTRSSWKFASERKSHTDLGHLKPSWKTYRCFTLLKMIVPFDILFLSVAKLLLLGKIQTKLQKIWEIKNFIQIIPRNLTAYYNCILFHQIVSSRHILCLISFYYCTTIISN